LLLAVVNPSASPKMGFTARYLVGDDLLPASLLISPSHQPSVRTAYIPAIPSLKKPRFILYVMISQAHLLPAKDCYADFELLIAIWA
jgi:hypothetical protein